VVVAIFSCWRKHYLQARLVVLFFGAAAATNTETSAIVQVRRISPNGALFFFSSSSGAKCVGVGAGFCAQMTSSGGSDTNFLS